MDPNGLLLMSVLFITSFSDDSKANQKAIQAYAKQSGIDRTLKEYERELIPQDVRVYLGPGLAITRSVVERRIIFQWSF